jgi:hypothetical protein
VPVVPTVSAIDTDRPWWRGDPVVDTCTAHPALALSFAVLVVAIGQVLTLTGGDANLALAVLSHVDAPTVVLGAVVSLLPVFAGTATLCAWLMAIGVIDHGGSRTTLLWVALAGAIVLVLSTPAWAPIAVLALGVLYPALFRFRAVITRLGPPSGPRDAPTFRPSRVQRWMLVLGVALIYSTALARPWVASERFTVAGLPIVGWAVGVSGDDIAVLTDRPRTLQLIPREEISARTLCDWYRFGALDRSIFAMLERVEVPMESCES